MIVDLFKDLMDKKFDFILSNNLSEIKSVIEIDAEDLKYTLQCVWYHFVFICLATTTKPIFAYQNNQISLQEFLAGKTWILVNWKEDILYKEFNFFYTN